MAKKIKKEIDLTSVEEELTKATPVDKTKLKEKSTKDQWVVKDRVYALCDGTSPLSYKIHSKGLYWFDKEKGYEREIQYSRNQKTVFVDEFKGQVQLSHIVFRNGTLMVPASSVTLQKFLSIYHPYVNKLFYEIDNEAIATDEVEDLELEIEALMAAKSLDIDTAEAVMRVELGSKVTEMSSKELKRDLLLYAKKNPELFLELVNDENVVLRNLGIRATEAGLLKLSQDQRTFMWGSNDRKLMNVPFDEHPYSALASWFKTDEGMEIYTNIEKQLK